MTLQQIKDKMNGMADCNLVELHEMGKASGLGLKKMIFLWNELKYGYTMKKIKIVIERGADLYAAYAPEVEGLAGAGETAELAKQSLMEALDILQDLGDAAPSALEAPFEFEYTYDVQSLLNYYKGVFTNAGLEKVTGINQKQLQHYASGLKKPRPEQKKKIENGLHLLANELLTIEL